LARVTPAGKLIAVLSPGFASPGKKRRLPETGGVTAVMFTTRAFAVAECRTARGLKIRWPGSTAGPPY